MHKARQRCFELLAPISRSQHTKPRVFPSPATSWPNWTIPNGLHSRYDFARVDYEGRQDFSVLISVVMQRGSPYIQDSS